MWKAWLWFVSWGWMYCMVLMSVILTVQMTVHWRSWDALTKLGAFTVIVLTLHVWEEWVIPGGFHYIYNIASAPSLRGSYPMNKVTDMVTNFGGAILWFILLEIKNGLRCDALQLFRVHYPHVSGKPFDGDLRGHGNSHGLLCAGSHHRDLLLAAAWHRVYSLVREEQDKTFRCDRRYHTAGDPFNASGQHAGKPSQKHRQPLRMDGSWILRAIHRIKISLDVFNGLVSVRIVIPPDRRCCPLRNLS